MSRRGKLGNRVRAEKRMAAGPMPLAPEYQAFVRIRITEGWFGIPERSSKEHVIAGVQSGARINQYEWCVDGKPWKRMGISRMLRAIAKRFPAARRCED